MCSTVHFVVGLSHCPSSIAIYVPQLKLICLTHLEHVTYSCLNCITKGMILSKMFVTMAIKMFIAIDIMFIAILRLNGEIFSCHEIVL